ncbi:MAG: hypothetical protein JNL57_00685 [Bacteroidetes bacterium]|nr:hypothetical protein [Bacteroidota bacterium]
MKSIFTRLFPNFMVNSRENDPLLEMERLLFAGLFWILLLAGVLSILLGLFTPKQEGTVVLTFLLVAAGSMAGGMALGFLFGLPRSSGKRVKGKAKEVDSENGESEEDYSDNTNLEEVSDWITKIILGLSLIKIQTILSWMENSAKNIGAVYNHAWGTGQSGYGAGFAFAYATLVFFFLAGAGICYLWARTSLTQMFKRMRKRYLQLEHENKTLITQSQEMAEKSNSAKQVNTITETAEYEKLKRIAEHENAIRKINDKTDIQKGRWGGAPISNGFVLSCNYSGTPFPGFHKFKIQVMIPEKSQAKYAAFILHDTFNPMVRICEIINQTAYVEGTAYEAFVVGCYIQDGDKAVELELDLNTVSGFPDDFYWGK